MRQLMILLRLQTVRLFTLLSVCVYLMTAVKADVLYHKSQHKILAKNEKAKVKNVVIIRVGVISYDELGNEYRRFKEAFDNLEIKLNKLDGLQVVFQISLTTGTYDEILEWYQKEKIDLALLNPGSLAILLNKKEIDKDAWESIYIGTRGIKPERSSFVKYEPRKSYYEYHSIGVVCESDFPSAKIPESQLLGAIKEKILAKQARVLFVHPNSTSGYIFPKFKLNKLLNKETYDYKFTYSHDSSLSMLCNRNKRSAISSDSPQINIAFVSDETRKPTNSLTEAVSQKLRQFKLADEQDKEPLPQDAILTTSDFRKKLAVYAPTIPVTKLFSRGRYSDNFFLNRDKDAYGKYKRVQDMLCKIARNCEISNSTISLEDIVTRISNYNLSHKQEGGAHVALVLSGGGAKCAYQIGAAEIIEEKIAKAQVNADCYLKPNDFRKYNQEGEIQYFTRRLAIPEQDIDYYLLRKLSERTKQYIARSVKSTEDSNLLELVAGGINKDLLLNKNLYEAKAFEGIVFRARTKALLKQRDSLDSGSLPVLNRLLLEDAYPGLIAKSNIEVNTVVGTSGGAINALTFTLGSLTREKWDQLKGIWKSFAQADMLKLRSSVIILLGLCLGIIFSVVVIVLNVVARNLACNLFTLKQKTILDSKPLSFFVKLVSLNKSHDWKLTGKLFLCLSLLPCLVAWFEPANYISIQTGFNYHYGLHLWEILRVALRWSAGIILFWGVVIFVIGWFKPGWFAWRYILAISVLLFGICSVSVLYFAFIKNASLFVFDPIREKMRTEIPKLLEKQVGSVYGEADFEAISREITANRVINRNLIITGSNLRDKEDVSGDVYNKQDDLYFYYSPPISGQSNLQMPADARFISLNEKDNHGVLLDVVIGSGSIFPLFEANPVSIHTKNRSRNLKLIDGGFIHNSPVEAARLFGATHIILLEASPKDKPQTRQGFLHNCLSAFNYLFDAAQQKDLQSYGEVEIYILRPDSTKAMGCALDFGSKFINSAIENGKMDALEGNFERVPGNPIFAQ